jgi:hypothetical protein
MTDRIAQEWVYRWQLWQQLHEQGGLIGVSPQRLRTLGLYGGAQGIKHGQNLLYLSGEFSRLT